LAKRLTEKQKKIIIKSFKDGITTEDLSKEYNCTNSTIIRNLKKALGEKIYKELVIKCKNADQKHINNDTFPIEFSDSKENVASTEKDEDLNQNLNSEFIEILPVDFEIDNTTRKELSSVPLSEVKFPKIVYMIVDKNIELEIKLLKDYPEWEFLPNEDLKRKTIEIYYDLKLAKRACSKEHKVIKVPNTDVFRIVSPILISRGISRIVSADKLIAL
jgi:hypothetical protein